MTSKQVMLTVTLLLAATMAGCAWDRDQYSQVLVSPYTHRQVWAVAPLRNESGSLHADGDSLADKLADQLEQVKGIEVIPVNRVLAAMDSLHLSDVRTRAQAMKLRRTLGVDALVIGTISAYNPYDPPKLGMAIELYQQSAAPMVQGVDTRRLTEAATENQVVPARAPASNQPVSQVSGYYDAASPSVRQALHDYANERGVSGQSPDNWRLYRISMDLYSEFVSHAMVAKLIQAEKKRMAPSSAQATQSTR